MHILSAFKILPPAFLLGFAVTAHALDWSSNSLGIKQGDRFGEPGIAQPIEKRIYEFVHASGDKWGRNLLVGQVLQSDSADPATGGDQGAQEVYAFYRRTLSLSTLTGHPMAAGPIKDVSLVGRVDRGAKNNPFAPAPRKLFAGASIDIDVPKGFVELGLYAYRETNHNGIVGKPVDFRATYCIDTAWSIPVSMGLPVEWRGSFALIGKKGSDGFGNQTKPETFFHTELLADIGQTGVKAGVGYEIWRNKFGTDQNAVPGAKSNTAMLVAEYHF